MTRPLPRRADGHADTAAAATSADAPAHPRLTTEWIRFSPGAGPGISEATIGWVLSARRRLLVDGGWQLLDLIVYETLYTLVEHAVDPELGVVLQWTGTYEQLSEAIGGGNARASKDGRFLFRADALRAARDRLERRRLITTRTLREARTVSGVGQVLRTSGMVWRLVPGGEAAYDERLSRYGADVANDPDARDTGSTRSSVSTGSKRETGSPGSSVSTGTERGPGSPGSSVSTIPAPGTGSPGLSASTGTERGTGSPGPRADLGERATVAAGGVEPGRPVSSSPSSPPSLEKTGPVDPAPGTPGERVAHLLTDTTAETAVEALVAAGWDGPRRSVERFVEQLRWRALAVPLLVAEHREDLAGREHHVVKFVRNNLTPGKDFHLSDDELADLILGEGAHAATSAPDDVTAAEWEMIRDLRSWWLTGDDSSDRHHVIARFGDQFRALATERGVEPRQLSDADVVAVLRGSAASDRSPEPAAAVAPPPASPDPADLTAATAAADPPADGGAHPDGEDPGWLLRAGLLIDDPLQPDVVRQAWAAVTDPDRRRLLVLVALDVLEGGWRDELERLVEIATSAAAVQVRARTGRDLRWQLAD